jgi:ABC-2 type transport system ATP-binding protein
MLLIENLCKQYGKLTAVDNLSLQVDTGAIFGLVGPNGAGKTTTMKILAALLTPTSGKAWIAGEDVSANPARIRQLVGYMPDFFGVYDDLKVDEYLDFYAASYGIPVRERRIIIGDLLELVDLSHKRQAYVDSLSRGMKQRLCLARSLVHDPALLILDEPASGLDPRARVEMRELLKELKAMGKTIIISSHILPELSELCTHIAIMEAGRLVIGGTNQEIVEHTRSGRTLQIRVMDQADAAALILQEELGLTEISFINNSLELPFSGSDEDLNRILTRMVECGIPVVSFCEGKNNLEDIFLQVTKGVVQ